MWFVFAASSAVCFGLRGILYQWSSQKPLDRNLMLFGVYLCGTGVAVIANIFTEQAWNKGALMGISMGVFSFISNASMYKGFAVGKASLVAIFTGLPPVVVVAVAYLLWGEQLSWGQMGAFIIILGGILLIRYSNDLTFSNLQGVQWAILAMLGFAFTDLSSKQSTMWDGNIFPTLTVMYTTGALLFLLSWRKQLLTEKSMNLVEKDLAEEELVEESLVQTNELPVKKWSSSRTLLWGIIVGFTNISGMMLILPAFKLGVTGLVSAIIATNVLIILFYVRVFLKVRFSRSEVSGITLAITGVILLRLLGA